MTSENTIQTKINNADSNTSASELLRLLYAAKEYPINSVYDSAGVMPTTDSANIGRIAFAENNDAMYVLVGLDSGWQLIDSNAASASEVPSHIQGSTFGYSLGGRQSGFYNYIEKYSYTADGNSTDVANLTASPAYHTTSYSSTDAFTHGGYTTSEIASVDKINFASGADATDFGDFPAVGRYGGGNSSPTHGYQGGGLPSPNAFGAGANTAIFKFPHSAGSVSTSAVGDLTEASQYNDTNSSATHGYHHAIGGASNKIEKYPFASDTNAADVGDLLDATGDGRGTNSGLLSDVSGGYGYVNLIPPSTYNISRYSFVSDGNATDHTDLNTGAWLGSVSSSTTSGYLAGGLTPPPAGYINVIQKFPYASTTNGTDVGDLLGQIGYNGGAAN